MLRINPKEFEGLIFAFYLGYINDMLEISEPVNVWVFFKGSLVEPWCFFWKGRQIKVEKINLVHTSKEGSNIFYHFSVSSGGNFYRLRFSVKDLKWALEAVDEDYSSY